jgi:initiation factor 1A
MVKNTKGGKKAKNLARKNIGMDRSLKYEDLIKTEDQEYAKVTKINGGNRYNLLLYSEDGNSSSENNCLGISRGKINKTKVELGTIVLISTREFQPSKVDILHIYNNDEVQLLVNSGDLSQKFIKLDATSSSMISGDNIIFSKEEEEDEDDVVNFENL